MVPAANKAFSPPWAEINQPTRWSSEYHDRFAFNEHWYQHMRRSAAEKEMGETGAGVDQLTVDSLLLPWDPQAPHRRMPRPERGVADVLECDDKETADDRAGPAVEASERKPNRRVELAHTSGPEGSDVGQREHRHRPSGLALAWQEPQQSVPAGSVHTGAAWGKEVLAAAHGLVSECLEKATKPRADLDVHGTASRKAVLSPEAFTRQRGAGKPPPNSGAAPQGQAFMDRGPSAPPRYGKGPGLQAKPGASQGRPRSTSSTGRGRAARKTEPASKRSYTTYSENWYAKRDNSFGQDLRAFQEAARQGSWAAGAKPLLPATKYAGISLPVSTSSKVLAKDTASRGSRPQGSTASTCAPPGGTAKAAPREQPPGVCKRKALQHGRPQLAAASKAPATAAVDPPPPEREEAVSRGRVTAVPGLSLYQPAVLPQRTSAGAAEEPREEIVKVGDKNTWRAAPERSAPVDFAGAGGGRASDSVLALTSPNLVGAPSQVAAAFERVLCVPAMSLCCVCLPAWPWLSFCVQVR